ncbi:MAG TPA: dihydrofolate reductase [Candidatus Paceibacterota bacterium]
MHKGTTIALIAAVAQGSRAIASEKDPYILWRQPTHLSRVRYLASKSSAVLLGWHTFGLFNALNDSPISDSRILVLTRGHDKMVREAGGIPVRSLVDAVREAKGFRVLVVGGSQVFRDVIPHADYIHLTVVYEQLESDIVFPFVDAAEWGSLPANRLSRLRYMDSDAHETSYEYRTRIGTTQPIVPGA